MEITAGGETNAAGVASIKKKILFVENSLGLGGAEKALLEMISLIDPDRYEISLFLLVNRGEFYLELPSYVRVLNGKKDPRSVSDARGQLACMWTALRAGICRGSVFRNIPYLLRGVREFRREKKPLNLTALSWKTVSDGSRRFDETFDLAVAFLEGGATYYVADHVKAQKKVAFVHINYREVGYFKQLDGNTYERFDRIYTISESVRESFLFVHSECEQKVHMFQNKLNRAEVLRKAKMPGFQDGYTGRRLVSLGRLYSLKGYDIALRALKLLKNRGISLRWYVLGEGPQRKELERLQQELSLQEDFVLMGATVNPYPYLSQGDLYVHVSRYEGKSVAIEEARTLGKMILASDVPGNREQIENGVDGVLVPPEAEAVAEKIEYLLGHPEFCEKCIEAGQAREIAGHHDLDELLAFTAAEETVPS